LTNGWAAERRQLSPAADTSWHWPGAEMEPPPALQKDWKTAPKGHTP
jgi:hypothetical protein